MIEALATVVTIAAVACLAYLSRRSEKAALHREFEATRFETPAGSLRGADVRVVKYVFQKMSGDEGSRGVRTGWWYCVVPGPRWLLVIGQDAMVTMTRMEMSWVVRELSEERIRGALTGDEVAIKGMEEINPPRPPASAG